MASLRRWHRLYGGVPVALSTARCVGGVSMACRWHVDGVSVARPHLEAQVLRLGTPAKAVPSSYTEGDHPAFADVNDYFKAGLYPAGRQRLYNLLAIVDNFQPLERDAIESKASYMLADSWRLEAELLALKESTND